MFVLDHVFFFKDSFHSHDVNELFRLRCTVPINIAKGIV
jgi:hypothetical protein